MANTITVELVVENGRINQTASNEAFNKAVLKLIADLETESQQIAAAVKTIYDNNHGKAIGMPTLGSMVAQALNAVPENFKILSDRALDYVRANSQGDTDKATKKVERPDSTFVIIKGKNGGCYRRADRPVKGQEVATPVAAATVATPEAPVVVTLPVLTQDDSDVESDESSDEAEETVEA